MKGGAEKDRICQKFFLHFYLDTIFFFMQRSKEECKRGTRGNERSDHYITRLSLKRKKKDDGDIVKI